MTPEFYMQLALDAAWRYQGLTFPNPAVGACVVGVHGEILALNAHQKAGEAHAEVLALRDAYTALSGDETIAKEHNAYLLHDYLKTHHKGCFKDTTLYVTLEPCAHVGKTPSCTSLIVALGIAAVVIAHDDPNLVAAGGTTALKNAAIDVTCNVLHEKAAALLLPFSSWQHKAFVLFKWAQRLDGTIDGGIISSQASRRHVHALRNVCDLLVIGGNTVRLDRPTLDARMVDGKAPDVLIYSHHDDFDRSIALFNVPERKVYVESSLQRIELYQNVLVEGGSGMYEALKSRLDCCLAFISPKSGGGTMSFLSEPEVFEPLHVSQMQDDLMLWMKRK